MFGRYVAMIELLTITALIGQHVGGIEMSTKDADAVFQVSHGHPTGMPTRCSLVAWGRTVADVWKMRFAGHNSILAGRETQMHQCDGCEKQVHSRRDASVALRWCGSLMSFHHVVLVCIFRYAAHSLVSGACLCTIVVYHL
jgi:hypothetical protein